MFDRILVPLDGTEVAATALTAAGQLAGRWGCELEALALMRGVDTAIGVDDTIREQVKGIVDPDHLIIRRMQHSVADDIAVQFDKVPNTLVVMNTDAHSRSAALADNVAEQVMRGIRQPMLLLGNGVAVGESWPSGPILVCTDGSDVAESVAGLAGQWAVGLGLPLMLVTVIDRSKVPAGVSMAAETNAVTKLQSAIRASVADGPSLNINYDALHGSDPAKAIVDFADQIDASMIVLATHGRTGIRRALYGSVAMEVVRNADCPVLTVRP